MSGRPPHDEGLVDTTDETSERWARLAMQARFSRLSRELFDVEVAPPRVGRFELESLRGTGAMGAVFAARDPELDRRVAVKLLTIPDPATHAEQLRAEAKALARLSHPNVVTVHEAGVEGRDLFLVMELVDGGPLSQLWLEGAPSRRALLDAFLQAGEGLVAMHEAGIVHCDFKPGNVLLSRDGRVKVADFGLARLADVPAVPTQGSVPTGSDERSSTISRRGTPAYMAPEQLAGSRPDPRSDQFSYCVCLWEALHGCRPFPPGGAVRAGPEKLEPRRARPVPRWLERALLQGLAADPSARWPTMRELVHELRRASQRGRTTSWAIAFVLSVPAAMGVGQYLGRSPTCVEQPDALAGAWDAEREHAIAEAWQAGPPFQRDGWPVVRDQLDRWAKAWIEARAAACRATFEERRRSDAAFDRSIACLERRRAALVSATELLASGKPEVAAAAGEVLGALELPGSCLDEPGNDVERAPVPATPEIVEAEHRVDQARLLIASGDPDAAIAALGVAPPPLPEGASVLAEHHLVRGRASSITGQWNEAIHSLVAAAQLALRSRDDAAAAEAFLERAALEVDREQPAEARRWLDLASAEQQRAGAKPRDRAHLLHVQGLLMTGQGDPEQAEASHRAALEQLGEAEANDPLGFAIRRHLAVSLAEQGRFSAAEAIYADLTAQIEASLGAHHPDLGTIEKNLAIDAVARGQLHVALAHAQRAHELLVGAFGESSIRVAPTLTAMADGWVHLGAPGRAVPLAARAWHLQREHLPAGHSERGSALATLAWVQSQAGEFEAALASLLELEREYQQGPHRDELPAISHDIGLALCGLGRYGEARDRFTTLHHQLPTDHPLAPYVASGLAVAELALGQHARAEALATETLARVLAIDDADSNLRAELRLVLTACRLAAGERAAAEAFARAAAADEPSLEVRKLFAPEVIALLDGG